MANKSAIDQILQMLCCEIQGKVKTDFDSRHLSSANCKTNNKYKSAKPVSNV